MSPFKMKGFPMKSPTKHKKFGQPHPINVESGKEESSHLDTAAAHNVKSPNKQVSAHGQENDYEVEKNIDEERKGYWYKINGKEVTKEQYIAYENDPAGDEPGKQTNDPDVYGKKASNFGRGPKTK